MQVNEKINISDIVSWAESKFGFPIPETERPIKFQPYQKRILRHIFAPQSDERLKYSVLIWSEPKKSGKTTIAALIHLYFALRFKYGEQYCCANDQEGARSRVYAALCRAIELNPYINIKPRKNEVIFPNKTILKSIPSDYKGEAGSNHTLVSFDEPWGYFFENMQRLIDEFTPVPTRKISIQLFTGYAGFETESIPWKKLYNKGMAGEPIAELSDIVNRNGEPACRANGRLFCFWSNVPRMPWQTSEYYEEQRQILRPNAYLRLHENRWVQASEDAFLAEIWQSDINQRPIIENRDLPVYIGVDASTKHDSSAVAVVSYDEKTKKVILVKHRIWQPSPDEPLDIDRTIGDFIRELNKTFNILKIRFDPYQLHQLATEFQKEGIEIEEFPQTVSNLTDASQNLYELVKFRNLSVYVDSEIEVQVKAATARESSRGWRIAKDKASKKIDFVVALAMACLAAVRDQDREGPRIWRIGNDNI